jgi:hypothetical protein
VKSATFDAAGIAALPHVSYSGVRLATLLESAGAPAGAPAGAKVKGSPARSYVIVSAADGYAAVFTLAELDTTAGACAPVLADRRNGLPIAADTGPFRTRAVRQDASALGSRSDGLAYRYRTRCESR